ncbi:hypothetical protein ACFRCI_17155 [Streptomyces sp. NPDC056638]|uniref:hypothetical protein n=1 Tax=Streptomyces sp. NPDC056638 TaxID=3345887 RepID=UPI0036B12E49
MTIKADITKKTVIEESVTLTMSRAHAETLASVLGKVGGNRETSPRGHAEDILDALVAKGFKYSTTYSTPADHPARKLTGSLMFESKAVRPKAQPSTNSLYGF